MPGGPNEAEQPYNKEEAKQGVAPFAQPLKEARPGIAGMRSPDNPFHSQETVPLRLSEPFVAIWNIAFRGEMANEAHLSVFRKVVATCADHNSTRAVVNHNMIVKIGNV